MANVRDLNRLESVCETLRAALVEADGFYLLSLIDAEEAPAGLQELKMIKLLRQMWDHQFELKDGKVQLKAAKDLVPAGEQFDSPYDPQARYVNKRATEWRGYKAHFTESRDEGCPFLICNVETTKATIPDLLMSRTIHDSLRKKKLLPATHLLDSGYIEATFVMENAQAEEPVEIIRGLRG